MESELIIPRNDNCTKAIPIAHPNVKKEINYTSPYLDTSKSIFNPSTSPPNNSFMSRLQGRNILYQRK